MNKSNKKLTATEQLQQDLYKEKLKFLHADIDYYDRAKVKALKDISILEKLVINK